MKEPQLSMRVQEKNTNIPTLDPIFNTTHTCDPIVKINTENTKKLTPTLKTSSEYPSSFLSETLAQISRKVP